MGRQTGFQLLEGGFQGGRGARWIAAGIVTLILANALAVILESDPAHYARWAGAYNVFESFSIVVFTVEYLLRIWVAPEHARFRHLRPWPARARYLVSPLALTDLVAILPAYLGMILHIDLRYLRLLRLLRLLKLTHYFKGLDIFFSVVRSELRTLFAGVATLVVLMVVAASLMYGVEHAAQPGAFGTIGDSLWWAVVTMTTVGYGDVTPITGAGRLLAALIMLLGVGIVALPAGILAARFVEELRGRRDRLAAELEVAMADGKVNEAEYKQLEQLREELGISEDALNRMLQTKALRRLVVPQCPHCGRRIE